MELIDKQKIEAYIDVIGDDLETLESLQTEITAYRDKVTKEITEQLQDYAAETASLTTPFTYIAFKAKQLTDKEAKEYTVENIFLNANSTIQDDAAWFKNIPSAQFEWPTKK